MKISAASGFTLIEISIVLVIIGLLVGGVLVGQDLIHAAEIRATITQVERFNTAKNTFFDKYGALPGDMDNATALKFGFTSRPGTLGQGDGNGVLGTISYYQCGGETGMYWSDMTYANGMNLNLIEGSFGSGSSPLITPTSFPTLTSLTQLSLCFPAAKMGRNNYFYVYGTAGNNYYGLSGIANFGGYTAGVSFGTLGGTQPSMSVLQAYSIDHKMDDGLPVLGSVQVNYVNQQVLLQSNGASTYTSSTCYNSSTGLYATDSAINGNGSAGACALSFRFQ